MLSVCLPAWPATPVIMGQRALGTYTFLPEDAIYLQKEDETTAQVSTEMELSMIVAFTDDSKLTDWGPR